MASGMKNTLITRYGGIKIWTLRILLALIFAATGTAKMIGVAMVVAGFNKIGLGQGFRYVTGTVEIIGAILTLNPHTTFYGTLVLLAVCIGAFAAEIGPLRGDVIHVFVIGAGVMVLAWLTRPPLH